MEKLIIEMPIISRCDAKQCGYNVNNGCHAKAITVGDGNNPGCDTFLKVQVHTKETKREAGVGACKVNSCQYNVDFECTASSISVGMMAGNINCLTFSPES